MLWVPMPSLEIRPPGRLPVDLSAHSLGRSRTCWRDYISHLAREHDGIPQEELEDVAGKKDVWATYLACRNYDSHPDKRHKMDE